MASMMRISSRWQERGKSDGPFDLVLAPKDHVPGGVLPGGLCHGMSPNCNLVSAKTFLDGKSAAELEYCKLCRGTVAAEELWACRGVSTCGFVVCEGCLEKDEVMKHSNAAAVATQISDLSRLLAKLTADPPSKSTAGGGKSPE